MTAGQRKWHTFVPFLVPIIHLALRSPMANIQRIWISQTFNQCKVKPNKFTHKNMRKLQENLDKSIHLTQFRIRFFFKRENSNFLQKVQTFTFLIETKESKWIGKVCLRLCWSLFVSAKKRETFISAINCLNTHEKWNINAINVFSYAAEQCSHIFSVSLIFER